MICSICKEFLSNTLQKHVDQDCDDDNYVGEDVIGRKSLNSVEVKQLHNTVRMNDESAMVVTKYDNHDGDDDNHDDNKKIHTQALIDPSNKSELQENCQHDGATGGASVENDNEDRFVVDENVVDDDDDENDDDDMIDRCAICGLTTEEADKLHFDTGNST